MSDTARDHLERALAWMTTYKHDDLSVDTRIATARAEVEHALWLLDAIPPRDPTKAMLISGWRRKPHSVSHELAAEIWRAMYDAALAEREGK